MSIAAAVELAFAVIGGLTFLSFLFVLALFIDARRATIRRNRERALRKHPACAVHDWDAALAALIATTTEEK